MTRNYKNNLEFYFFHMILKDTAESTSSQKCSVTVKYVQGSLSCCCVLAQVTIDGYACEVQTATSTEVTCLTPSGLSDKVRTLHH